MQSTKQSPVFPPSYSNPPAHSQASPPQMREHQGIDRSFVISCGLGAVTVIFGVAALIYQFTPEFNKLRNASGQAEMPKFSTLQG